MAKRRYEQRLRAESAEQTRRRILDAFRERLTEEPRRPVSVEDIARRAGVARSTVYLVFGSRAGLFEALRDDLLASSGFRRILDAVRRPDARETVRDGIAGGVEMFAAHHDVLRVLFSLARLDPDAADPTVVEEAANRAAGMARLASRLAEQGHLRPGVSEDRAADVLWLLTSFEAFESLHYGRGMAPEAIAEILVETAERTLLA